MTNKNSSINYIFWGVAIAVCSIALGSFTLSFMALYELATENGVSKTLGFIWPLIVDMSMIIYTAGILIAHLQRRGAKLPIALTIFYAVVTITGNLLHAPSTWLGWFVASLPPLSLIFGTEMLRAMAHHNIVRHATLDMLQDLLQKVDTRQAELVTLNEEIEQGRVTLQQLKVSHTEENDSMLQARQAKMLQDVETKEQRHEAIVTVLSNNPKADVTDLATMANVSRQTIYRDLSELVTLGLISKNGEGYKVSQ